MILSEKQILEFETAMRPAIKYLNDRHNPHDKVIISTGSAELVCGELTFVTDDYIKD